MEAGKSSKTAFRPRQIPLVGLALDAFKACPNGFTDYIDKPDYLAIILGGHIRGKGLFPSDEHTLYSLRHSFQDRLTARGRCLPKNCSGCRKSGLNPHKF